jgi:hypothetical protein
LALADRPAAAPVPQQKVSPRSVVGFVLVAWL